MAKEHNAYGPGYRKGQVDHHEWRTAENSAEQLLPTLIAMEEENPKLKFLDVGAGSGTLTASFSKYIPHGHITAVDLSEEILGRAKEYNGEQKIKNVTFQQASVYELPFADETFDVVHTSQMVVHLDAPHDAIKELVRVCKTGGVVSIRDADVRMSVFWPSTPGLDLCLSVWNKFQDASGGSSMGGRKLVSNALKAGVKREQIEASFHCWCYSSPKEREMWCKCCCSWGLSQCRANLRL